MCLLILLLLWLDGSILQREIVYFKAFSIIISNMHVWLPFVYCFCFFKLTQGRSIERFVSTFLGSFWNPRQSVWEENTDCNYFLSDSHVFYIFISCTYIFVVIFESVTIEELTVQPVQLAVLLCIFCYVCYSQVWGDEIFSWCSATTATKFVCNSLVELTFVIILFRKGPASSSIMLIRPWNYETW